MSIIDTLITDRTQADVDALIALLKAGTNASDHKGSYNASDLNRVGEAVNYIRERLYWVGIMDNESDWNVTYELNSPAEILCIQHGHGNPSLNNIRTISPGITITDIGPVYGGEIDVQNKILTVNKAFVILDGTETWTKVNGNTSSTFYFRHIDTSDTVPNNTDEMCSHFAYTSIAAATSGIGVDIRTTSGRSDTYILFRPGLTGITTAALWESWLAEQYSNGTPVTCCYPVSTPSVYQLADYQLNEAIKQLGTKTVSLKQGYKTDWTAEDIPTSEQMRQYLSGIEILRRKILSYRPDAELPESMRHLDYEGANKIEKALEYAEDIVTNIMLSYRGYSGRFVSWVNCLP